MTLIELIIAFIACAGAAAWLYGQLLIELDNDKFRKEHGYKPKYHEYQEEDKGEE